MRVSNWYKTLPFLLIFAFLIPIVAVSPQLGGTGLLSHPQWQQIKTIFIGIFLEALPFVLLGVFLSSLLQMFVKDEWIARWCPKNPILGVVFASCLGFLFPICECGMIPVVRRLMLKGLPAHIAVTFILSGPILNPVVFAATMMAFRSHSGITYGRMGLAFAVAVLIGLMVYKLCRSNPLKRSLQEFSLQDGSEGGHRHDKTWSRFFVHAGDELIEMGKYVVLGVFLTSVIQSMIPRDELLALGDGPLSSYGLMMGFAFILSLCSTSDAFVASAFSHVLSPGPLLSFLVLGPMLDFKSLLMLFATFKPKFVISLSLLIIVLVFTGAVLADALV